MGIESYIGIIPYCRDSELFEQETNIRSGDRFGGVSACEGEVAFKYSSHLINIVLQVNVITGII